MLSSNLNQYEKWLKENAPVGRNARILIIEDDLELLEELEEMLFLSGYQIRTVADSNKAFETAHLFTPHLILLDLQMHPKTGFKVAEELHNSYSLKDIPMIAMTGCFTEKEHVLMMKLCGIKSFILKPFEPHQLVAKIEFALGHRTEEFA